MTVLITDEFHTTWSVVVETTEEAMDVVRQWMETRDETPIYEITILLET
jgi:hypothetical protein